MVNSTICFVTEDMVEMTMNHHCPLCKENPLVHNSLRCKVHSLSKYSTTVYAADNLHTGNKMLGVQQRHKHVMSIHAACSRHRHAQVWCVPEPSSPTSSPVGHLNLGSDSRIWEWSLAACISCAFLLTPGMHHDILLIASIQDAVERLARATDGLWLA